MAVVFHLNFSVFFLIYQNACLWFQGVIWVLESDKVSPRETIMKLAAEQKSKKEIVEVFPVKKNARIKDHSLILTNSDGSHATIELVGCVIVTVSSSSLPSRKW